MALTPAEAHVISDNAAFVARTCKDSSCALHPRLAAYHDEFGAARVVTIARYTCQGCGAETTCYDQIGSFIDAALCISCLTALGWEVN